MANYSFEEYAQKYKYEVDGNIAYGKEKEYLVTLYQGRRFKIILIPLPAIKDEEKQEVLNFLKSKKDEFKLVQFKFDNTVLTIKIKEPLTRVETDLLENVIKSTVKFLYEKKISLGQHCIFCGQDNAEETIKITRINYNMHQSCYDKAIEDIDKEKEIKEDEMNYGYIGAIVGVAVIAALWILFSGHGGVSSILTLLFAPFAFRFYLLAHGKIHKYLGHFIVGIVFFTLVVSEYIILVKNKIPFSEVFKKENFDTLINLELGLVFTILGLSFLIYRLRRM